MSKIKLTAENVESILYDCFFKEGEDYTNRIEVEGIMMKFGFHPDRLQSHAEEIAELCDQLPADFKKGMSFLNACVLDDYTQWGEHQNVEQLMALGLATKKIGLLTPRPLWPALPGGMPYLIVN